MRICTNCAKKPHRPRHFLSTTASAPLSNDIGAPIPMNAVLLDSRLVPHPHEPLLPQRPGWVDVVPVLSALLRLADDHWQGIARVRDGSGNLLGALRFAAGSVRAAHVVGQGKPLPGLVGLCSGSEYTLEAWDATQQDRDLVPFELDLLQLTAAVMRGPVH